MARVTLEDQERAFPWASHPYNVLAARVVDDLTAASTLLDVGCGRSAARLRRLVAHAGAGYGIDVEPFSTAALGDDRLTLRRVQGDRWPLETASIDVAYSVSVFEHLEHPALVLAELRRVLKPGGVAHILTPNRWDYASVAASLIPNRLHPWLVARTEGRAEADTFPTYYRANTRTALAQLAADAGLVVRSIEYRGSAPTYLAFSQAAFMAGTWYHRTLERHTALHWLQGWLLATVAAPVNVHSRAPSLAPASSAAVAT